jgi:arsenate reductase
VRDAVRAKEPRFAELKLADKSDAALLNAVAAHPILVSDPIEWNRISL